MDRHPDVAVIVVSYNSGADIRGALHSFGEQLSNAACVIADSGSADDTAAVAAELGSTFLPGPNHGFGVAVNRAAGHLRSQHRYLLLVNPDVRALAVDIAELAATADRHPDAAVFAIEQVDQHGRRHPSLRREPRWWRYWAAKLGLPERFTIFITDDATYSRVADVAWAEGSFLLVRAEVFEELGGFDDRFPLYAEETDLCRRVRNAGHAVRYLPGMRVEHRVADRPPNQTLYRLAIQGRLRYVEKWGSRPALWAMRALLAAEWAPRALLPRRDKARQREARATLRVALGRETARLPT